MAASISKTYVVEHLDTELEAWSALEYRSIAQESHSAGASFLLSSVSPDLKLPAELAATKGLHIEQRSIEETHSAQRDRVCLLDPQAEQELCPADAHLFDVFLFGGILGTRDM
jgi:carboxypeptidase D